jgi:ATP-binding cassette subfamily B protein
MRLAVKEYYRLLHKYLEPHGVLVLLMAILLFISVGLHVISPQIARLFIDGVQRQASDRLIFRVALLGVGIGVFQVLGTTLGNYVSWDVAWKATNALRVDLVRHCLHLDLSFHNKRTPGEMIERIDGDVSTLSSFFSQFVFQLVYCSLLLLGILVTLFLVDWRIGSVLTLFSLGTFAVLYRLRNVAVPYWEKERQASAELFGFLEERIQGTEDIRSNGAVPYVLRCFHILVRALMQCNIKAGLMVNLQLNTIEVLFTVGMLSGFLLGAGLFRSGAISMGAVFLIFQCSNMLQWPITTLANQLQDLQRASASISRIRELLNTQSIVAHPAVKADAAACLLKHGALAVDFSGVSFRYKDAQPVNASDEKPGESPPVLEDISFRIAPGKVLGLLGRTGSGKTSLSRLLFRFYDPDSGRICLGNEDRMDDLRQIDPESLKEHISLVTQNVQLFHASVRDNLTFFDSEMDDERVLSVFRELGLWSWFQSLDKGLDTELEAGGTGLSAGEAQLLAFCRVFLRDPGLVILDEASSRLDPASERLIERALDRLIEKRTALIIAHRLQTVERADEIMILEEGRIVELGPRRDLACDPSSRFSALLKTGLEEALA